MGRAEARRAQQRGARRAKKTGIRRFFTWRKLLGAFFGFCLLIIGAFVALYLSVDEPAPNAEAKLESNVYKYGDGKILARTGRINREMVDLDKIPEKVRYTFVAAENKSFFKDSGVDLKGTARGLLNTVTGKGKQGGSTITQQYVKNYYLTQQPTVSRKLKELVISLKVDRRMHKEDILAGYINTSYYGRSAYGIQAAAQAYYGVDAEKLTVAQGAYLAALLQAPSQYDWAVASPTGKKLVTERWHYVLDNMVEEKWLDASERDALKFPVPHSPKPPLGMGGQTGYLVEAADAELRKQGVSEADLKAGGWTITLNIDEKKQKELVKAVERQLESKIDRKGNKVDATVQAGATSVDPKTGAVVALYGGTGATEHWISNATRQDYQPASTFKPLVFATALENGAETQDGDRIGVNTLYDGTSRRPVEGSDTPYAPQNEDDTSYGDVNVQEAMDKSINSVFAQMVVDVGPGKVKETALALGVPDKNFPERPATALGTMYASTWDMAGVYATFDNHGKKVTPTIVKSAEHRGRSVDPVQGIGKQVLSRKSADTVTSVLSGVVDNGSGHEADTSAYDAAGKTGTSENNRAALFAGYTPELSTVVALYGESPKDGGGQVSLTGTANSGRANGGGFPAKIWADYTLRALNGGSDARFDLEDVEKGEVTVTESPSPSTSASESPEETPSEEPESPEETPSESESESPDETVTESPSPSLSVSPPETSEDPGEGEDDGNRPSGNRPGGNTNVQRP
ncbi:transglycosylase domain-containing protein [Streptomyces sp. DT24]|uniref:transglycosylase domain-containing protein n=1 Tax=Streptomyces sp. DT24 TaxID=3416520 RepID=UPI003CFAF566